VRLSALSRSHGSADKQRLASRREADSHSDDGTSSSALADLDEAAWQRICFYASPISDTGTEQRRHSDALLNSLVLPAIEALDPAMEVIRADNLASSPITGAVYEHVFRSGLVIADLSYHNPSVLYELGVRHTSGRPCVLISRTEDEIPANLRDVRIVLVNTSELGVFLSERDTYRADLTRHARWALLSTGQDASPLQRLFPAYRDYIR
jgi:hypothetical protein